MSPERAEEQPKATDRRHLAAALAAVVLWQVYVVAVAYRNVPALANMLEGFGGELPAVTRAYLSSYKFFALLPLATLVGGVFMIRGKLGTGWASVLAVALGLVATMAVLAWTNEAFMVPLLKLMEALG